MDLKMLYQSTGDIYFIKVAARFTWIVVNVGQVIVRLGCGQVKLGNSQTWFGYGQVKLGNSQIWLGYGQVKYSQLM